MISVVVPVYNAALYIERFLQSLFSQIYSDYEVIFVDDCGTDDTMIILENFLLQYKGCIHYSIIHHTKNRGASAARNTGLSAAAGDFIYYADCDDEITTDCLSLLAEACNQHPDAEVIVGGMESVPYRSYYDLELYKQEFHVRDNNWVRYQCFKEGQEFPVSPCNKLLRKNFLLKNNLFFKEGIVHEDELWIFNMCSVLEAVSFLGRTTYIRYINPDSVMTSMSRFKSARTWLVILEIIINNINGKCKDLMLFKYLSILLSFFEDMKEDDKYLSICRLYISKLNKSFFIFWGVGTWIYVFLYPVHHGKFVWRFRKRWLPAHWRKLSDKCLLKMK